MDKKYIISKLKRFCGFIAGIVFYVSGLLKLMDPTGAGLVVDEYLSFMHISFLDFSAEFLGTAAAFAETLIGAALITGVWRRLASMTAFCLQTFFTLLTLALVIFNPEMDCGCFGEAIHLTHVQTFVKNLILLGLLSGYMIPLKDIGEPKPRKFAAFGIVAISTTAFMAYSLLYIPLIDFTDYKATASIRADIPGSSEEDMYEAVFVYEKDGKQETFQLSNLPDSTWTFIRTETKLNKDTQELLIPLSFYSMDGTYEDSLAYEGKVMVVSIYDPDMSQSRWNKVSEFTAAAQEAGFKVLILTAGTPSEVLECIPQDMRSILEPHLYFCDYKTLISLNRSNGGLTFFSDGYLIRKWAARAIPDSAELQETASTAETEIIIGHSSQGSLTMQGFLLYVFAVMSLL